MSATNAVPAKRAIVALLQGYTGPGQPLDEVRVSYAWRGDHGPRFIYLGAVSFAHSDRPGDGVVASVRDGLDVETATIAAYVRVTVATGDDDVRDADEDAHGIGAAIHDLLADAPKLAGADNMHYLGVGGGRLDYAQTDDEVIVVLTLNLTVASYV